jgi:hypothetical protein
MKRLVLVVTLAAALAGCASNPPPATSPTTTPVNTTPATTATPGVAATISVASSPSRAPAGGNATVCWQVTGVGHVAHTAVHYDNASHPGSTNFADYAGGAMYPDNQTSVAASGYDLPGSFCTAIPVPATGIVYYRAHVIDSTGGTGKLSDEKSTRATGTATSIVVLDPPASGPSGSPVTVCWRVEGTGNVAHTALHWDNQSHATTTRFSDYAGKASYPGNQTSAAAAGYDLPGTFCSNLVAPTANTLYYRAHVIDASGGLGRLTDEQRLEPG